MGLLKAVVVVDRVAKAFKYVLPLNMHDVIVSIDHLTISTTDAPSVSKRPK